MKARVAQNPYTAMNAQKKSKREIIIEIAKIWPGHEGVNYETTKTKSLLLLIQDAVICDQELKHDQEIEQDFR